MKLKMLLGISALFLLGPLARGQVILILGERQQERKSSRWTLGEWLLTKRKIDAQNAWLAAHSNKTPVDFTLTTEATYNHVGAEVDLYVSWLGLRAGYESPEKLSKKEKLPVDPRNESQRFSAQLRLFGSSIQDTNLIVRGTYEKEKLEGFGALNGTYIGWSAGPELQIYFAKWLGVRGDYHSYFGSREKSNSSRTLMGYAGSGVGFIEVSAIRIEVGSEVRQWNLRDKGDANLNRKAFENSLVARLRLFL